MKRAIISLALAMTFCARSPGTSKDGSATGGAGGMSNVGGTTNAGGSNTGGTTSAGTVCSVSIPSEVGATCDVEPASDAGPPPDAGSASVLTKVGPYAVGHVSYMLSDAAVYARSVFVGVWYPVDPGTITSTTPPAQYPLDAWGQQASGIDIDRLGSTRL